MELERKECPICYTQNLVEFVNFGQMPIANAFLKKEQAFQPEFKYEMAVGFCENCKMVQLINIVPYDKYIVPDKTGKTNYAFFSSTSKFMEQHFAEIAREIEKKFLEPNSQVLEIGSNDGIFLKAFKKHSTLGIEPSNNVADVAKSLGIETITDFFSESLARKIVEQKGKFKTIFSANVILNIINIHDLFRGVNHLLEDNGVFIFEDPYIVDILEKTSYDQIYDEHVWYFSLTSLSNLLAMHGMEIFHAQREWVHGGSMRVYTCKKGVYEKTEQLKKYLEEERQKKIHEIEPYIEFAKRVHKSKQELSSLLNSLKSQGKKIVGYAAASKGTIVLNYCDIGKETLDYISDSTPFKQGLYSPGKHIPIVSPEHFHQDNQADYALLSAWNHAKEIVGKEKEFIERGGQFIVHYPEARILDPKEFEETETENKSEDIEKIQSEKINEIQIKPLKIFANDQGYLFETLRADDEIYNGQFGQNLVSTVYPGIIKGFHLHEKQTDYTTCIKGNLKYIAVKPNQDGTATFQTFVIGEKNPAMIKCPPGIWHGYTPVGNKEAMVLHTLDKTFNPQDDDTQRKDPFEFGDVWTPKHG
ncbi:hypothetical protein CMI37_26135 [Candidatus Pacearchaeota archaeon]|nr:hypothetical protein [Candidatus Pacearchaeota archaeon]|tara:strand:+ start:7236 stop:8996 length:1761 start_codon:yes stop_codon:yes gene_type:complete